MKVSTEFIGSYPPIIELPVTGSEAYTKGTLLTLASGTATLSALNTDGTKPHMFLCEETKAAAASGNVKVSLVLPHVLYETTSSASLASNTIGTDVTLYTGAATITATATKGVCTLMKKLSATSALVQFRTIR